MIPKSLRFLKKFFIELNVPINSKNIISETEKYLDFPSLKSIIKLFNSWNISFEIYELTPSEFNELKFPFITYLFGEFAFVKIKGDKVLITNSTWNEHELLISEFGNNFNGYVLSINNFDIPSKISYIKLRISEWYTYYKIPMLGLALMLIFLPLLTTKELFSIVNSSLVLLLIILKIIGIIITLLLISYSLDKENSLASRFCNSGKCDKVLSSKRSNLFKNLSWSEIGLIYFSGTLLVLLFKGQNIDLIIYLGLLNILGLPYTIFSIFYQFKIVKQWCLLCISVQILIWAEFLLFIPLIIEKINLVTWQQFNILFSLISIPIIFWIIIKPYLHNVKAIKSLKLELYDLKYNLTFFSQFLKGQIKYDLLEENHSIWYGNPDTESIITIVSNPFCKPCNKAHKFLCSWIAQRPDYKMQLVYYGFENKIANNVINHFMNLKYQSNEVAQTAASFWDNNQNYNELLEQFPLIDNDDVDLAIKKQVDWCRNLNLEFTPTILINGQKLPNFYMYDDIKYLL